MKAQRVCLALLGLVLASGVGAIGRPSQLSVRDAPFSSSVSKNAHALTKARPHAGMRKRDETPQNGTSIERSWNGATLFKLEGEASAENASISGSIEVTCVTCYVKGHVTTEIQYDPDFDITQAILNFTREIGEEIENITSEAKDYLEEQVPDLFDDIIAFNFDDISLQPLDIDFNVDLPEIPESTLRFQFDDLELYMVLDTVISAGSMYTLNLYSSNTVVGLSADSDTFVGIIASIDLILKADADIKIESGLHIKIDDGMALELSLFGQNVSSVTFNGGSFEFLPVTVQSASGVLTATLRMGMSAGVAVDIGSIFSLIPKIDVSGGAEAMVYADLAEFTTNITAAVPDGDQDDCQIRVQQGYQLALGAAAGASFVVGPETWGPDPSTNIPIFYTTLTDICAFSSSKTAALPTPTATTALALSARADEDLTTTTLTEEVTFTGVVCVESGRAECPASLRATSKVVSTKTLVTVVPEGSEATFPATTRDSVADTIPFAANVQVVKATTGSPVSYVPPPPPPTSSSSSSSSSSGNGSGSGGSGGSGGGGGGGGGSGKNLPLIIGLSVGLGVPFLAAVFASAFFLLRRRRYTAVPAADTVHVASPQDYQGYISPQEKKTATATTAAVVGSEDERT